MFLTINKWGKPSVLLVCLMLLWLALVGMRVAQVYKAEQPIADQGGKGRVVTTESTETDIQALTSLNIFGKKSIVEQSAAKPQPQELPKTRLKLILKGAFTSTENQKARALIAESRRGKGKLYYIDDRLPGGAVLHEVFEESVTLERGGRLETLDFPRSVNDTNSNGSSSNRAAVNNRAAVPSTSTATNSRAVLDRLKHLRRQQRTAQQNIATDLSEDDRAILEEMVKKAGGDIQVLANNPAIPADVRREIQRAIQQNKH